MKIKFEDEFAMPYGTFCLTADKPGYGWDRKGVKKIDAKGGWRALTSGIAETEKRGDMAKFHQPHCDVNINFVIPSDYFPYEDFTASKTANLSRLDVAEIFMGTDRGIAILEENVKEIAERHGLKNTELCGFQSGAEKFEIIQ